jgi:hypothetical protein
MKIEFIKKHPVGIKKGHIAEMPKGHAERLIGEGYALSLENKITDKVKKGKKKAKK